MNYKLLTVPAAYLMDLVFGDPVWMPHPVRVMGRVAEKLEPLMRALIRNERIAGLCFTALIVGTVWALAFVIVKAIGFIASVFFIYTSLAIKDLKVEAMRVVRALEKGDIDSAGKNLGMIVGRDTAGLGEREIVRATVETVSENIVDGIISPLFYALLGGAPLALAYKAASTLDSMVGYKNEKYLKFGWASARLDDIVNFIPSRISAVIMPLASWLSGKSGLDSFRIALRDGTKNPSPNSGIPEAAMAGALGVRLGGLNFYNSAATEKPLIGDGDNALTAGHIKESLKIAYISSGLFMAAGLFFIWLIERR